ncbi:hypothetical protein RUE5091_01953 [Ruegeria denitrificans]|uniref:Uncharacterized protein n=1 Tax=Ruegeria denitrificans TaxID=1715692 RepID=A0A0P1I8V7_9RHOB|nr:hypothetical protein [Ruegeria denitrificans]CUJ98690.1 hypothetical protein RUE5091_01953 [Ruegeria denitrificans]
MTTKSTVFLKAAAIAIGLMGCTAIVGAFSVPDAAYAKEGKGNGGGNGNGEGGKGKGNGGDRGNGKGGGGKGKSKADASGASKSHGKNSAGRAAGKSHLKQGSGQSKTGKFSLKGLFGGKKNGTSKVTQKNSRVNRVSVEPTHVVKSVRPKVRTKRYKMADLLGVHPSALGALNAANASETALNNAAPHSRVGRIAHYRDTVLAGEELREELEEKQNELSDLTPPERPISDIEEDLEAAVEDVQENKDRVDELEKELQEAGGSDPDIEKELEEANAALSESIEEAQNLSDEQQSAIEYEETATAVEDLTHAVEDQAITEREALENAANKPVTDEVEATVKSILGL